jgi:hypothetical protein
VTGATGYSRAVQVSRGRAAGLVNTILCDAIGLVICGLFVPGIDVNWRGLLIAVAIIALPGQAMELYLDRMSGKYTGRKPRLGRWATGFLGSTVWMVASPAVADWVTPDFNIAGAWQYLLLLSILLLVAIAYWRIVLFGKSLMARRA